MKKLFLLIFMGGLMGIAFAQFPTVTIQQIQEVPMAQLMTDVDTSLLLGDTVIVYGTVTMDGRVEDPQNPGQFIRNAAPGPHHNIWIQSGTGPWSGLDVFHLNGETTPTSPLDMLDLVAGDSVKITGFIEEFADHETEIMPLSVELLGTANQPITPIVLTVGTFNDANKDDNRLTGEQWEGMYVEFQNLTVVNIVAGRFIDFQDANGDVIQLSDRFVAFQNPGQGGAFQTPAIGAVFDTVRGVIAHGRADQDGYQLYPFKSSDLVLGQIVPPTITNIRPNPLTPSETQDINVSATITDNGSIISAKLFYGIGASTAPGSYFEVPMTNTGGTTYTGTIPNTAFSNGDIVVFYVEALDNDSLEIVSPDVPDGSDPRFVIVDNNGASIRNVQFTPFENGASSYDGSDVTVTGIVTSSSKPGDMGYVYIQQPGENQWAGLPLRGSTALLDLNRGDEVTVTGSITERFNDEFQLRNWTVMEVNTVTVNSSNNTLPEPVVVNPNNFYRNVSTQTFPDFTLTEPYEAMLVKFEGPLYVADAKPDGDPGFAEWYIGTDPFDVIGCRVQTGRQEDRNFSSLSFSLINDSLYLTEDGIVDTTLSLRPTLVSTGDTLCSLIGIMSFGFSEWKLIPRNNDDLPSVTDNTGELRLAISGANYPFPNGLKNADCANAYFIGLDVLPAFEGSEVKVYPNPSQYYMNVDFDLTSAQNGVVELRDMMGRAVLSERFNGISGSVRLNTENLTPGSYVVVVRNASEIIAQNKVLIAR
ncbi:MAG: T9SS type A sorting domain-containing protein [Bacteroidia bacterium]|nr:T9SS type A sorting domain-containing protein [Bacteroidia bacterium]